MTDLQKRDFSGAVAEAQARARESIGTYKEKTLHSALKYYYGGRNATEARIGKYVADAVSEDGIYEIQSAAFYRMKDKLEAFLSVSAVTVVFPIASTKYISWIDTSTGAVLSRNRSPKKGSIYKILPEIYSLRGFLSEPRLSFVAALADCEEYRYADGWSRDGKKGATKIDIVPTALKDELFLRAAEDYAAFIPEDLPEEFTSFDYAKKTRLPRGDAQKALLVLTDTGTVERTGRNANKIIYRASRKPYGVYGC